MATWVDNDAVLSDTIMDLQVVAFRAQQAIGVRMVDKLPRLMRDLEVAYEVVKRQWEDRTPEPGGIGLRQAA